MRLRNIFFLCTNPEKVRSVSEANRHFMWISQQVNHFLVIKQIGSGFNILRISFCLHPWSLAPFNTFAAMKFIYVQNRGFWTFLAFAVLDIFLLEIDPQNTVCFRKKRICEFQKGLTLSPTIKIEGLMTFQNFENFQWKSLNFGKLPGSERVNQKEAETKNDSIDLFSIL